MTPPRPSVSMAEAARQPPQGLYIADPRRLSVVEIKIIAESTSTLLRDAVDKCDQRFTPSRRVTPLQCPDFTPFRRSRTRSLEIGARAKEALKDIRGLGKSAAQGIIDGVRGRETSHDLSVERVDTSPSSIAWPVASSSSLEPTPHHGNDIKNSSRIIYILKPEIDPDGVSHEDSSPVRTSIRSYLETKDAFSAWKREGEVPIEFVEAERFETTEARAGTFEARSSQELAQIISTSNNDAERNDDAFGSEENFESYMRSNHAVGNKCLKVSLPIQYHRQRGPNVSINSHVSLHIRLHLPQPTNVSSVESNVLPAGSRRPRSRSKSTSRRVKIVFVSTDSWQKLTNAIESGYMVSSPQAARLEGIEWVALDQRMVSHGDMVDFSWECKDLSRRSTFQVDALGNRHQSYACAFIEFLSDSSAHLLSAFQFKVVQPASMQSSSSSAQLYFPPDRTPISQQPPKSGLAIEYPGSKTRQQCSAIADGDIFSEEITLDFNTQHCLQINQCEMDLEGVEEDGPMLRAAIQSLEKRTAHLAKVAKVIIKGAAEVREKLGQLQASQIALEAAFEGLSEMMPSTIGHMQDGGMRDEQAKASRRRDDENILLRDHVETPLLQVLEECKWTHQQIKCFEDRSKDYYSGTQKWLASKGATIANSRKRLSTGRVEADSYSPAAIGCDKSSLKQEKLDIEQKMRQLQFYLARLIIFRVMNVMHGGQLELQIAQHVLTLGQWQCTDQHPGARTMRHLRSSIEAELEAVSERDAAIVVKQGEVKAQLKALSDCLGEGSSSSDAAGITLSLHDAMPRTDIAKQRAVQVKAMLSSKASQSMHHSSGIDQHPPQTPIKRSSSKKGPNSLTPTLSADYQQHLLHTPSAYSHMQERSVSDPVAASPSAIHSNGTTQALGRFHSSLATPRSPPSSSSDYYHQSTGIASSFNMQRRSSQGSPNRRISMPSPCARVEETMAPPPPPNRMSLLQPRRAAQVSRKKEGVLWAMSRSIAGPGGGDDLPRSLTKSQNWKESWVVLSGSGHLGQYAGWKNANLMEPSQPLIDLRFATVRQARNSDRRFVFEIVTKDSRRFYQAANEEEMKDWISAIGLAIESLINGTSSIRQSEKVAKKAREQSPFLRPGDDFGPLYSSSRGGLGQHREFSQSLTDLSNMTSGGPSRLFQRSNEGKAEMNRKRNSRRSEGHNFTLSEGTPSKGIGLGMWSSTHERGISNKTPISGYLARSESMQGSSSSHSQSNSDAQHDYDRKIEEMIHTSFGTTPQKSSSFNSSAETPTRRLSSMAKAEDRITRDKYTRYKEMCDIVQRPQNRKCADCQAEDPKWASWALNGEPHCIFICIACSGIHRSLGVGVSKVKSVDLDDWTEDQIDSARTGGNSQVNETYEATKPIEINAGASGDYRDRSFYIRKYVDKEWYQARRRDLSKEAEEDGINPNEEATRAQSPFLDETWDGQWTSLKSPGHDDIASQDRRRNKDTTTLAKVTGRAFANNFTQCSPSRPISIVN